LEEQRCSCLLCSSQRALTSAGRVRHSVIRCGSGAAPKGADAHADASEGTPSKQKRRQSRPKQRYEEGNLQLMTPARPTHQCTNWELVRTGIGECQPTVELCSLERR